ncbi:ribonuclease J [Lebetimonas natsushimae]|uniref:Ribonuclease J n=1 Tax=Lebetimonas natsushimae TaxID=1936991 RepID=A0A292YAK3_9BACT|nr:ribonuclease J [Lebetimonas natsushimae]GAX86768.1 ribonuclease J [Lebetimonas natsushimae]
MEITKNNEINQILNNQNQTDKQNSKNSLTEKTNTNNSNNQDKKIRNSKPQKKLDPKNFVWFKDLNKAFNENEKIHQARLTTYNKINENTKGWVRFTPLGGLDEIGGNCAVLETENSAIIIDCGMSFPSEDMHGVDILIPDFSYLKEIRHKIKGLIITHGHEDHIGAVPYLFKEMQVPIYGTSLPLAMIENKFKEHKILQYKSYFRSVKKRHPIQIGDFKVEWIHMTHSIIDSSSLAIQTPIGTIIHTGDFKIDHTPIDGYAPDLHRLAYYGEKGVLALFSDSTNSYKPGVTPSESVVGKTFDDLFLKSKGRVIMSTFSSNIHRVYQAIERGIKHGRKVCIIGRSMEQNLNVAMDLGYIKLPRDIFIDPYEIGKYQDHEILIITTGSQGESMSALYRMAIDEHRHVKIKEGDQIVISAKAIPGNEPTVSQLINFLMKKGAKVAYQQFSEIHVSGHASQEEQKLMLRLVKPKYFFPVHGEYNHLMKHRETALSTGMDENNIFVMEDGEQWEITPKRVRKVKSVKTGKIYIDNQINEQIEDDIVLDRQKLASDGIIMIVAQVDKQNKKLINRPRVTTYGIIADKEDKAFAKEMEEILINYINHAKDYVYEKNRIFENELRNVIRKHVFRKTKKYPTIVPVVYFM